MLMLKISEDIQLFGEESMRGLPRAYLPDICLEILVLARSRIDEWRGTSNEGRELNAGVLLHLLVQLGAMREARPI